MSTINRIIDVALDDWAPHIERTARAIAVVLVAAYTAGYVTGAWLHRTSHHLGRLWARIWVHDPFERLLIADPLVFPKEYAIAAELAKIEAADRPIIQPQAAAITPANVAPPRCRPADPMARAVYLVRVEGRSQRLAGSLCGVSRSSLQRALKR